MVGALAHVLHLLFHPHMGGLLVIGGIIGLTVGVFLGVGPVIGGGGGLIIGLFLRIFVYGGE